IKSFLTVGGNLAGFPASCFGVVVGTFSLLSDCPLAVTPRPIAIARLQKRIFTFIQRTPSSRGVIVAAGVLLALGFRFCWLEVGACPVLDLNHAMGARPFIRLPVATMLYKRRRGWIP